MKRKIILTQISHLNRLGSLLSPLLLLHSEVDNFWKTVNGSQQAEKISQDALAKMVGVHGAVIGHYERDEVKPSIERATQIAEALNVSLDYLVGATDSFVG